MNYDIILVSNGRSMLGCGMGNQIDQFQNIVRFNNATLSNELAEDVGTRTTHWCHHDISHPGMFSAAEKQFSDCNRILCVPDTPLFTDIQTPNNTVRIPEGFESKVRREMLSLLHKPYHDSIWCTTGLVSLAWFLEMYHIVCVVGFLRDDCWRNHNKFLQHYDNPHNIHLMSISHDLEAEKNILDLWCRQGRVKQLEDVI